MRNCIVIVKLAFLHEIGKTVSSTVYSKLYPYFQTHQIELINGFKASTSLAVVDWHVITL